MSRPVSVLMVCLGNICRSPTAEGVLVARAAQRGVVLRVDSAGTQDWHRGKAPDPRTCQAAAVRGYDLSGLRARQVRRADFDDFDWILAMDRSNLEDLQILQPTGYRGHLGLLLDFARQPAIQEVPDPYYGGAEGFEQVLDLIEQACDGLLDHLQQDLC